MSTPRYPNAPRPRIAEATRRAVFDRDGAQCVYCGTTTGPFELDHGFPWSAGGSSEASNLHVCCPVCNRLAGDRVFGEFVAKRGWIRDCRKQLGPARLNRIAAALAAGDETTARREMEHEDS